MTIPECCSIDLHHTQYDPVVPESSRCRCSRGDHLNILCIQLAQHEGYGRLRIDLEDCRDQFLNLASLQLAHVAAWKVAHKVDVPRNAVRQGERRGGERSDLRKHRLLEFYGSSDLLHVLSHFSPSSVFLRVSLAQGQDFSQPILKCGGTGEQLQVARRTLRRRWVNVRRDYRIELLWVGEQRCTGNEAHATKGIPQDVRPVCWRYFYVLQDVECRSGRKAAGIGAFEPSQQPPMGKDYGIKERAGNCGQLVVPICRTTHSTGRECFEASNGHRVPLCPMGKKNGARPSTLLQKYKQRRKNAPRHLQQQ